MIVFDLFADFVENFELASLIESEKETVVVVDLIDYV
jgi:hypothetical protein